MVKVRKVADRMGAEVTEVDLKNMSDDDFRQVYQAFLDHNVLVFPKQDMDIPQYLQYSNRWGKVVPHITKSTRHPDYPELTLLGVKPRSANIDNLVVVRGEVWHSDTPYWQEPCMASQLYARAIPSYGGDTSFANMYDAYDALPERLKKRIQGLSAYYKYSGREGKFLSLINEEDRDLTPIIQPLVKVHPRTGRTALYVIPIHCIGMVDMDEAEGNALLEELYTYMVQPGSEYRHKWTVGDVVIWDNRCSIHKFEGGNPANEDRIHWRVSVLEGTGYEILGQPKDRSRAEKSA